MWFFGRRKSSGISNFSTAEEVTHEIDGSSLTAIVTGPLLTLIKLPFMIHLLLLVLPFSWFIMNLISDMFMN